MVKAANQMTRRIAVVTGIVILFIWLSILTVYTVINTQQVAYLSEESTRVALAQSELERFKQPVIDASAQKVYLYDAGLVLPLNAITQDVRYDIRSSEIFISLVSAIGKQQLSDTGEQVTCDKIVRLSKSKADYVGMQYVGEFESAQSGFKYIYEHTPCSLISEADQRELVQAVQLVVESRP